MRSLVVGPILGVRVAIHPTWLLVLAVIVIALQAAPVPGEPPLAPPLSWLVATAVAALFFLSFMVHELAHALTARRLGLPVDEISLFIFGGQKVREAQAATPRGELAIAAAGPLLSVVVGVLFLGLWSVLPAQGGLAALSAICWWMGAANVVLAAFQAVPSYPLDGGRVVRALMWALTGSPRRAMSLATLVGRGFAYFLMGVGLFVVVTGDLIIGVWLVVLGILLNQSARFYQRRAEVGAIVAGLTVDDVMERDVAVVSPNLTLDTLYEQHKRSGELELYPVTAGGALLGSIDIRQVLRVPRAAWQQTRVGEVMTKADRLQPMTGQTAVFDALMRFDRSRTQAIPVVDAADPRQLVGLVTRERLLDSLRRHAEKTAIRDLAADRQRAAEGDRTAHPEGTARRGGRRRR